MAHDPNGAFGDHYVPYTPPPVRMDLLETCWQMRGPSQRVLTGAIYQTLFGIEVRVSYEQDDLIYSQMVPNLDAARAKAAELKQAVVDKGGFVEV